MTKDEALKMAIDDLELCNGAQTVEEIIIYTHDAIKACKEALEQPAQKPVDVAMVQVDGSVEWNPDLPDLPIGTKLYTHHAPAWQGLSNDRIREIGDNCLENNNGLFNWIDFARAIEQALKEKNT